ncbi:hypothetical protein OG206_12915 [Streptomyces sp. NBC_01341]|uniref:hypothetical protein n=1 Tax=Streptomyces sp. NBC_01341 TaxID=2903831 RepID=UPI002E143EC2|nr:hypothetical protein OG206_12915 [Streptomyces sp. NBC_01341]
MPDRLRTALGHPLPERAASMLMRERHSSSPDSSSGSGSGSSSGSGSGSSSGSGSGSSSGSGSGPTPDSQAGGGSSSGSSDDNPFAAPPEDRPDQPWQPRHPSRPQNHGGDGNDGNDEGRPDDRPVWGSQWSDRQPGRESGGFGGRPGNTPSGQGGGPEGNPGGLRWDPTDPVQRRARYAVLGGMWAFFFALFDLPEIALLLGALAVYWSISALRGGPRKPPGPDVRTAVVTGAGPERPTTPAPPSAAPGAPQSTGRQQTTAAVSGLVTALLALAIVATGYTVQLVYRDYYTCVNDALTKSGAVACNDKLPEPLEPFFGVKK